MIEDSPDDAELLVLELRRAGYDATWQRVTTADELRRALSEGPWDVVVSDYLLPGFDAPSALELVRAQDLDVPFLIVSGNVTEEAAVNAMRAGAHDFFPKDNLARLGSAIARELREAEVRRERREAMDRLRQAEERDRLIVESVRDYAIFMLDAEGRVASWNEGAARTTGYEADEALGRPYAVFYPPEARAAGVPEEHVATARGTGSHSDEAARRRKDGRTIWADCSVHRIGPRDAVQGYAVVLRDVSERKQLVDDLREAIRVRDEFLAVASHELRTPLTSLQLQVQSLLGRSARAAAAGEPPLPPRAVEKLRVVERQVTRLTTLVNGMLDVQRITGGPMELVREPVDLLELVREAVFSVKDTAERTGYRIGVQADGPVVGEWDRARIETVVSNLVANALKYGQGKPIEIAVSREGDRARLRVTDHGIGIESEAQARIFERFERAVPIRHYGGLGLGLWITRKIVDAHGGSIRVASRPGDGTTFTVELPLMQSSRRDDFREP